LDVPASGKVLVYLSAVGWASNSGGNQGWMSFAASGANTVTGDDANGMRFVASTAGQAARLTRPVLLTGLTPGTTTFAMKYRATTASGVNASARSIIVEAKP